MANTFHVSMYVRDLDAAIERYRKILGAEPAKVRPGYAKFELVDPPVIFSIVAGGEPGRVSHLGIRYPGTGEVASEMVRTAWEMYTLLADVEAETADDPRLRAFLNQGAADSVTEDSPTASCCAPGSCG